MTNRCPEVVTVALASMLLSGCDRGEPTAGGSGCAVGAVGCGCTAGGGCDPGLGCVDAKCAAVEQKGVIPVDVPRAMTGEEMPTAAVVVTCTRTGELFVDGTFVDEAELLPKLLARRQENPDVHGVVQCDAAAPTERLVGVLDAMRQAGIRKQALGALVPPPEPERMPPQ